MNKKVIWILQKAFRYCFPYIAVNIALLLLSPALLLAVNILNKDMINELAAHISSGGISGLFIALTTSSIL
ncbi:MAG: hypothetical protein LBG76_06395 [Treponema sp.]|jgi:nitrate reductase gamma subunit|nr:hypothetical protein [Treponema sp.]